MTQIRWNVAGFRKIRYSPEVKRQLEAAGNRIAKRANATLRNAGPSTRMGRLRRRVTGKKAGYRHDGYKVVSYPGARRPQGRHQVKVVAASPYARRSNAKNNTLLKMLGGE